MNRRRRLKGGQPLAILASSVATLGLGAFLALPQAYADSSTTTSTAQSSSPYSVLGVVSSMPASMNFDNLYTLVGKTETWTASGLPANTTLNLVWETYTGQWDTQAEHFIGAKYTLGNKTLMQVTTDAQGNASGTFTVPSGFGDAHMVGLVDTAGNVLAAGTITVSPIATISSTTEPEGQFFHIHVDGVGVGPYTSDYEVLYDNHLLGNVSAVTTGGVADFTVRAEGGVGKHTLQLVVGGVEGPYLNAAQSPFSFRPNYNFVVDVTPGHPTTFEDALPKANVSVGNHLTASIDGGVVGKSFTLSGTGLAANHPYELVWNTMAGSRVSGSGYQTKQISLGTVTTDASGNFTTTATIPDDLGGPAHTIQLVDGTAVDSNAAADGSATAAGNVVGETTVRIYPTLQSAPKTVSVGQQFTVNLQGVGWTEYDNTYAVSYDNGTIGYVCGFNSHGDVSVQLQASGTPGWHYVDLYPSIYKGQQTLPYLYGIPLLTYGDDHPGDTLPAIHVAIDVLPAGDIAVAVNGSQKGIMNTSSIGGQTAVPLYNVMMALKTLGVTSKWDGHSHTWAVLGKVSSSGSKATGPVATVGNVGWVGPKLSTGHFTVSLNGKTLLSAASSIQTVPGTSVKTTYVPLFAVSEVLKTLGVTANLSDATWSWTTK